MSRNFLLVSALVGWLATPAPFAADGTEHLQAAVDHADRPDGDRRRDVDRKPVALLSFMGLEPGMQVVELMSAAGYYVEILSRAVGPDGSVVAHNNIFVTERFAEAPLSKRLENGRLSNVRRVTSEVDEIDFDENTIDIVMLNRFYHDLYWQKRPDGESPDRSKMNSLVFRALKPGGVFAVVDHHAETGSGARDVSSPHRVDAEMVKKEILAAGFELDAESSILSNPDDSHDWNIFSDDAKRRDKTDRFIYRFRKPRS